MTNVHAIDSIDAKLRELQAERQQTLEAAIMAAERAVTAAKANWDLCVGNLATLRKARQA